MSRTRRIRTRPSPAIVVAILALVAALAGTAVAANPTATSSAINKKKVKKIAKKEINKAAAGLSVAEAENAKNLDGQPASAFAKSGEVRFARIDANGTVRAQSKGIAQANVTKDGAGDYCIDGLTGPEPKGVSATIDWGAPFGAQIYTRLPADIAGKCQGKQIDISTHNSANASTDMPFYVVVF